MARFTVTYVEIHEVDYAVEAETPEEAERIATIRYENCETPDNPNDTFLEYVRYVVTNDIGDVLLEG